MNILMLNWRGPGHPSSGGAEQVTMKHCAYWASCGHNVYWFTSRVAGLPNSEIISGVHVVRSGIDVFGVQVNAFFWYLFGGHPNFDIVIDQFHGIPFFAPLYVKQPVVGFIHEIAQPVWHLNPWPRPFNLIPAIVGKYLEPLVFKLYSQVPFITVSASTQKDLQSLGIKKVTIIPNGIVLPNRLPQLAKEKNFTFIYLSTLTKDKGVEDALECFSLLGKHGYQYWVVGKGDPKFVSSLQKRYPFVKFFGFVSQEEKFRLLSRAHVLVFPSVHEGWGLVILEAASVGTPAIAYSVSGVKDAIIDGQTGLLAKNPAPSALKELCLQLMPNKKLYQKMSAACRAHSKQYSWDSSRQASLNYLKNLLYTP